MTRLWIDPSIGSYGEELLEENEGWIELALLLRTDDVEAPAILRDVIRSANADWPAYTAEPEWPEGPIVGNWTSQPHPEGALLGVNGEPHVFEKFWDFLVERLRATRLRGRLEVFDSRYIAEIPTGDSWLQLDVRFTGHRVTRSGVHHWERDGDAIMTAATTLAARCAARPGMSLIKSGHPSQELFDPRRQMTHALESDLSHIALINIDGDRQWTARIWPHDAEAVVSVHPIPEGWRTAARDVVESALAIAPQLVHARLVAHPYPPVPYDTRAEPRPHAAFFDEYLPDIHGWQLLGPGYRGRIPAATGFTTTAVNDTHTLLIADDLGAWLGRPPDQRLVDRARAELRPILFETIAR